jgi:hypothetical protein
MRALIAFLGLVGFGLVAVACGGAVSSPITQASDSGTTSDGPVPGDAISPPLTDSTTVPPDNDGGVMVDAAGPPCAPPSDPSKAAMCITITPEAIKFLSDPNFDGKGELVAQVFDTDTPDLPDGGSVMALTTQGPTQVDLSQPVPVIRFDGLPPTAVYARAVFVDTVMPTSNLAAGFWLGGYDLSNGIQNQTKVLPTTLSAGSGTGVTMHLVALRDLTVTISLATTPAGNGEGPAVFVVTQSQTPSTGSALFGLGKNPCARVDGQRTADLTGFVLGKGPYYVAAVLDDFGLGDGGVSLPPGSLTSLELTSTGGLHIPATDALSYPANAYRIKTSVTLGLTVGGDAGTDTVTCP